MDMSNVTVFCGTAPYEIRRQTAAKHGYSDGSQVAYSAVVGLLVESSALAASQHELAVLNIMAGGRGQQ